MTFKQSHNLTHHKQEYHRNKHQNGTEQSDSSTISGIAISHIAWLSNIVLNNQNGTVKEDCQHD